MAVVLTEGRLRDVHRAPMKALPTGLHLSDQRYVEYAEIWRRQRQVRTVVAFLSRNIAQLGLHTYRRVSDVDRQRLTDHPLARLLAQPAPGLTQYRWLERVVADLAIYDVAILAKIRRGREVAALAPIPPTKVRLLGENWMTPDGYRIQGSRGKLDLTPEQVVAIHGYDPEDLRWGVSPMEMLRQLLIEEAAAEEYRGQLWRNSARASGYLTRPMDAPEWSTTARKRFKTDWQAQYTGTGPQAGGTPVLEDGMTFKEASVDPSRAQYIEARKLTREEVAAAYFIPPPMVGILDHATYSNIREQHKHLYQDTLGPWMAMLAQEIGLQVVPDMADNEGVYVEFNIAEKMRGSFEEQASAASTSTGRPWMTVNEQRARFNLPQVDGGDELVVPLNVLLGDQASPTDSVPPEESRGTATAPRPAVKAVATDRHVQRARAVIEQFFRRQHAGITASAEPEPVDTVYWAAELAAELYAVGITVTDDVARTAAAELGMADDIFDLDRTLEWLAAHASGVAEGITAVTAAGVDDALADPDPRSAVDALFDGYLGSRAAQIALTETTALSGFATVEVVQQSGRAGTKTWKTRSQNSRSTHARLNGETVPLGELFSNRARWPGDSRLSDEERANCKCHLEIGLL